MSTTADSPPVILGDAAAVLAAQSLLLGWIMQTWPKEPCSPRADVELDKCAISLLN